MKSLKTKNCIMSISTLVMYVKRLSKNNPQNYIQYDHQELYFNDCDQYFTQFENKKDHEKRCIIFRKFYKNFKSITKIK